MDSQTFFNVAVGLCGGLGGFILHATWQALEKMRADLQALQASIAETYIRRDDFKDSLQEIRAMLARIDAKLDGKVDK